MHRTQLCLEERQYRHVRELARLRKTSIGQVVRRLIEASIAEEAERPDPVLKLIGRYRGPKDNISERVSDYLYGWPEKK